jgi:hypothetical protein
MDLSFNTSHLLLLIAVFYILHLKHKINLLKLKLQSESEINNPPLEVVAKPEEIKETEPAPKEISQEPIKIEKTEIPQNNATEKIEAFLFEMSSDVSLGKKERAYQTLRHLLGYEIKVKKLFVDIYFQKGYHYNRDMFEITLIILNSMDVKYKTYYLNHLFNQKPFHLNWDQILKIRSELGNLLEINHETPLLLCFYANDIQKLKYYISIGYNPEKVICKEIGYSYSQTDSSDPDQHCHFQFYKPRKKHRGKKLSDVLKSEGTLNCLFS